MSVGNKIKEVIASAYSSGRYSVLWLQKQTHAKPSTLSFTTHHSCIVVPLLGSATYRFGNTHMLATPGTLLHSCPDKQVTLTVEETPYVHINIYYDADSTQDVMHRLWSIKLSSATKYHKQLEALVELGKTKNLQSRLNQIVGTSNWIASVFENQDTQARPNPRVECIKDYIEGHFFEPIKIADLARDNNMSAQALSLEFKRLYNISPQSLITKLRLERACTLLSTNLAVKDVAKMVGYNDPLYFSRIFKTHMGCAPTELWR